MSSRIYVLGGTCLGVKCSGGTCPWSKCLGGKCPGEGGGAVSVLNKILLP